MGFGDPQGPFSEYQGINTFPAKTVDLRKSTKETPPAICVHLRKCAQAVHNCQLRSWAAAHWISEPYIKANCHSMWSRLTHHKLARKILICYKNKTNLEHSREKGQSSHRRTRGDREVSSTMIWGRLEGFESSEVYIHNLWVNKYLLVYCRVYSKLTNIYLLTGPRTGHWEPLL